VEGTAKINRHCGIEITYTTRTDSAQSFPGAVREVQLSEGLLHVIPGHRNVDAAADYRKKRRKPFNFLAFAFDSDHVHAPVSVHIYITYI